MNAWNAGILLIVGDRYWHFYTKPNIAIMEIQATEEQKKESETGILFTRTNGQTFEHLPI